MNLNCVIVDDEYLAIAVLEQYAAKIEKLKVLKTFTDAAQAFSFLQNNTVDVLLVDIQMPYMDGFDLVKALTKPPLVIFTTARHDYAVKAYDEDILDYLVKPFEFERFSRAIQKATDYLQLKNNSTPQKAGEKNHLMIKADYRVIKVGFDEIQYIEGLSEYVKIHTGEKVHTTLAALKELEHELPAAQFIRIHKSYIIAITSIADFSGHSVKLKTGKTLAIGRSYKKNFISRMKH